MSSRIFQGIIVQMREATDRVVGIVDTTGTVVSCSELSMMGTTLDKTSDFINSKAFDCVVIRGGKTYKLLPGRDGMFDYAVFVEGEDEHAKSVCILASIALGEAKAFYEEKFDKAMFVKNVITENIMPGDIYVRARDLRFDMETVRAVFIIRQIKRSDIATLELIKGMFPNNAQDFVLSMNETDIVLVKEVPDEIDHKELRRIASGIEENVSSTLGIKTVIGIGSLAKHLRELADRYKEAQTAIEVGKVFDGENTILNYESLGIGRLIYQLPTTLCEMFLSEVFKKNPIDSIDQETLYTISKFFENNLNVSETARKLFVHRNTLVYRLEKIKKLTGLDLREFDYAIIFKVALMVKKYLESQEAKY
ncbi:MAG: helix-turn-helix domain-containing protein [Clostridia bacterium]|nr:helix-turn-helix domain-containing protein [Clostridia bacterium]